MKGILQEALDSAREALKEIYEEEQLHHINFINAAIANTGGYMNGTPFDEESTKGNGKDVWAGVIDEDRETADYITARPTKEDYADRCNTTVMDCTKCIRHNCDSCVV